MKICLISILSISMFSTFARADMNQSPVIAPPPYVEIEAKSHKYSAVSITGQNGSIHVPSAFIEKGRASIAVYNSYTLQDNILGVGNRFRNDTVYGAFSYAPLQYLEVSIGSIDSSSNIKSPAYPQSISYSGDLRIGIKGGYELIPHLSIAGLGEILTYSKAGSTGYAGYDGNAVSYTLSLLMSYDMLDSGPSFPMIANLRIGYLWDNTQKLISSSDNNFILPLGKYAMGIRGDNLTLLAFSLLFPLPKYYIEPMLEFTSQFADGYGSYAATDSSYASISFNQNPMYLTPGIIFYTPIHGLRIAVASELSLSKKLNQATGSVFITPQTVWIVGLSYSI